MVCQLLCFPFIDVPTHLKFELFLPVPEARLVASALIKTLNRPGAFEVGSSWVATSLGSTTRVELVTHQILIVYHGCCRWVALHVVKFMQRH